MISFAKIPFALAIVGIAVSTNVHSGPRDSIPENDRLELQKSKFSAWYKAEQNKKHADVTDRFIVNFADNATALSLVAGQSSVDKMTNAKVNAAQAALNALSKYAGEPLQFVRANSNGEAIFKLQSVKDMKTMKKIAAMMASSNDIESAEPDPRRYLMSQMQPWGIGRVQADQVADTDSGNRTVCIIDSGYELSNEDLANNNVTGTNDSGTGNWYQNGGSHGTHVAGTIAGINNTVGVVGIMPNQNINLHIVKVFNDDGWGYSSDLVGAVNACVNAGSNVINMSLGGPSASTAENDGMQAAYDAGVLVIAAAGNDGNSDHSYPASYDSVMSVGALDEGNQHAEFSQYTNQVEISAPGEAILSTVAGDGRQGYISFASTTLGDDRVAPQTRFISSGGEFVITNIDGQASGNLAACSRNGSTYSCGDMSGKICIAERYENQGASYPEINPVKACSDAGANGIIIVSNDERPGLQSPFVVDADSDISIPTVSVNQTTGQQLTAAAGTSATLTVAGNRDYSYYNGTSMASPHVAGVAALAWSTATDCTAAEVRNALTSTAIDLDTPGRDNRTGYGLVQTKATADLLGATCGGTLPPIITYCDANGDNSSYEWISGVTVGSYNNNSGAANYTDFTQQVITLSSGATAVSLTPGFSGSSYNEYWKVWIDLNSDGDFDDANEEVFSSGSLSSSTVSGSLQVPAGATGQRRMRVVMRYNTEPSACGSFDYGEVEDYTVDFGEGTETGGPASFENTNNYNIPDNNSTGISSPITSTRSGASNTVTVDVNIVHTWSGDLTVDLIHPDGSVYNLRTETGGSADNIVESYTKNIGSKDSAGTWNLRVKDGANQDTGYINSWTLSFE